MAEEKEDSKLREIKGLIQQTVSNRVMLVKMEIADDISRLIKGFVLGSIAALFIFMCLLFASFLLANWIGQELNNPMAGFGIVAGAYLVLLIIIVFVFGGAIGRKIDSMLLHSLFDRYQETDDNITPVVTEAVTISNGQ